MEREGFSINARTCTLRINEKDIDSVLLRDNLNFIIPIYQRPYSWTEHQIEKLITDIFVSFHGNDKKDDPEPMFIGTMQLSQTELGGNGKYFQNIIDGQQRLTTLLIILNEFKILFPEVEDLRSFKFNWLETKVNSGEQNAFLKEYLANPINDFNAETGNRYVEKAKIIRQQLQNELTDDAGDWIEFDASAFVKHLFKNIYFVVIETRAGLLKTLKVFDAINTTGLDLNGGDLFKIRMYEYLTSKVGYEEDDAFPKISALYAKIDRLNKKHNSTLSILDILSIYQMLIISTFELPNTLHSLGASTFFERLFDSLLNISDWKNFTTAKTVALSLNEIDELIDARYMWEAIKFPTVEDACCTSLIRWSRYGRYWKLVYLFVYQYRKEDHFEEKLFEFIRQLSKLYFIYSVRFQKAINEIHRFSYELTDLICGNSIDEVLKSINAKIGTRQTHNQDWYDLDHFIAFNLTQNAKRKNLVCRLSAMLEEDYKRTEDVLEIKNAIFSYEIDIEHIQSYNDKDAKEREEIKRNWGRELNSIGNLMVLEGKINRSIGNEPYSIKLAEYKNSRYKIVQKQIKEYPTWDKEKAAGIEGLVKGRRQKEVEKLYDYLFSKQIDIH